MWNFDAKKMINKFEKTLEEEKWLVKKLENDLTRSQKEAEELKRDLKNLSDKINSLNTDLKLSTTLSSRLDELELWRGKVHGLLIEQTPTGRDKLTPLAKMRLKGQFR